jgi:hypothetical protein
MMHRKGYTGKKSTSMAPHSLLVPESPVVHRQNAVSSTKLRSFYEVWPIKVQFARWSCPMRSRANPGSHFGAD